MKKLNLTTIVAILLAVPPMAEAKKTDEMRNWDWHNNGVAYAESSLIYYVKWQLDYGVYFTTSTLMGCQRKESTRVVAKINGQPVKFKYSCLGYGVYLPETRKGKEFVNNAFAKSSTVRVQDLYYMRDDITFSAIGFTNSTKKAGEAQRKAKDYENSAL